MSIHQSTLVISGYRDYNNYHEFSQILDDYLLQNSHINKIIFGECKGTDTLAKRYCVTHGIRFEIYAADWSLGPKAGPLRNNRMLDQLQSADSTQKGHLLAFLSPLSKGTKQCVDEARRRGIMLTIVDL